MAPIDAQQILTGTTSAQELAQRMQSQVTPAMQQPTAQQSQPDDDEDYEQAGRPSSGATVGQQLAAKGRSPLLKLLANNTDAATKANPEAASKPGGWARAILGGAMGMIGGVAHDFGDAAAVKGAPGVQGAANVLAARNQRINQENVQKQKLSEEQQEAEDKHQNSMALLAHTKMQQLYQQRLLHNLDSDELRKQVADGQQELESTTKGEFAAPIYEKDVDSDEYNRFLQEQKKKDPNARVENFHAIPTGIKADDSQPSGYRTLYTIAGVPQEVKPDEAFAARVNPWLPDGQKIQAGGPNIPGSYANWLVQQANNSRTAQAAATLSREKADLDQLDTEQKLAQKQAIQKMGGDWTGALGAVHNDPFKALTVVQGIKNPDGTPKYPNAAQTVMDIYGGPKEWETMRKDQANEKAKQQDADTKAAAEKLKEKQAIKYGTDVDPSLSSDQFRDQLPIATKQEFKAIYEGRQSPLRLQGRAGELTDAGLAFTRAYPDYDIGKGKEYPQLVKDFTSGKIADTLTGYGVAMNHARMMFDSTGFKSYIPGTQAYAKYNQDAKYLATEVAKALNPSGVATDTAIKEQLDALTSSNPNTRQTKLENAMDILGGKYQELQQRWDNGLPDSKNYHPPMPGISQDAQDNYTYVKSGGKNDPGAARRQQTQQQQGPAKPNAVQLPPQALKQLKEGQTTTFGNGQSWMLKNGQPVQVQQPQGQ